MTKTQVSKQFSRKAFRSTWDCSSDHTCCADHTHATEPGCDQGMEWWKRRRRVSWTDGSRNACTSNSSQHLSPAGHRESLQAWWSLLPLCQCTPPPHRPPGLASWHQQQPQTHRRCHCSENDWLSSAYAWISQGLHPRQRHLHSVDRHLLHVPRGHSLSMYGTKAFATAGPSAWNRLLDPVYKPNIT